MKNKNINWRIKKAYKDICVYIIKKPEEARAKARATMKDTVRNPMMGVQRNSYDDKYAAIISHEHTTYRLGNFDTIEGAYAQYMKYKALLKAEKQGGAKVDLTFNTRENKRNQPPPTDEVLPKYIILTKNYTYKIVHNKKLLVGTFKTAEQAKAAYDVIISKPLPLPPQQPQPEEPPAKKQLAKGLYYTYPSPDSPIRVIMQFNAAQYCLGSYTDAKDAEIVYNKASELLKKTRGIADAFLSLLLQSIKADGIEIKSKSDSNRKKVSP